MLVTGEQPAIAHPPREAARNPEIDCLTRSVLGLASVPLSGNPFPNRTNLVKPSAFFLSALLLLPLSALHAAQPLNILFFTADDMNHDSTGVCGGPIKDLTPNVDQLASEGLRFEYAYSTVAVCQPVRQTMQTGLYPHHSGSMGFFPLKPEVRTLNQQLHDAGYLISMFGKGKHNQPAEKFCVDVADDTISRHPSKLAEATRKFLTMARQQKRPFFHNVNCYDPHRPFIGINGPKDLAGGEEPSRWIKQEEITGVPGFLEDLPEIRRELAGYYTNVRRLDDAVGAVLKVLKEEGFAENTLVVFYGGDHGMSFPFSKSNDYETSSRGSLIIRWPGVTKSGVVDHDHLVSTLDFAPTLLEAAGLPALAGIDGRSFLPVVKGGKMTGWDHVFTFYNAAFGNNWLPMRCMRTKDRSYIWNAWSNGTKKYHTENMAGLSWKAMVAASSSNPEIAARADFYLHRVPEEFYDMTNDRSERVNLIADGSRQEEIDTMRKELLALMQSTGDPFAEAFAHRDNKELVAAVLKKLNAEYVKPKVKGEE
jgi:N-sulfoglucosamine sulfohydrolase